MFRNRLKIILALILLGLRLSAMTGNEALGYFETVFSQKAGVFQADIEQATYSDVSDVSVMKGRLVLKKPDKFSIEYDEPEKQTVKCDGRKVWVYIPSMNQAVTQEVKEIKNRDNILFGFGKFLSSVRLNFTNTLSVKPGKEGLLEIESVPKSGAYDFRKVVFLIDREAWLPVKITVYYSETSFVYVKFYHPRTDTGAADSLFEFTPPEGTTIVDAPLK